MEIFIYKLLSKLRSVNCQPLLRSFALEEAHRPNPAAFRGFIDTPFVIAALREAKGKPLNIREFVERFLGYMPKGTEFGKISARVQNCLDYLKARGAVAQLKVPGKHGTCWRLTPAANNIPLKATLPKTRGKPDAALAEQERKKIINILAQTKQGLGTTEIMRRLLKLNLEEPTADRLEHGLPLVRRWLSSLRKEGIIRSVKPPKGYEVKWQLVNWGDEIAVKMAE